MSDVINKIDWAAALRNTVENVWDHKSIVMGLDIDSMGSAAFLQKLYPSARVIALYETEYVVQLIPASASEFAQLLKSALWVDQDVLNNLLCIGQHLITGDCSELLHARNTNSFNPNEFFKQQYEHSFRQDSNMATLADDTDCLQSVMRAKCPYSTLMLLLHAFDDRWTRSDFSDALVRHADSVASNILHYTINCEAWRRVLFAPTDSQLNKLVLETQKIYKNSNDNECICKECAKQHPARHAKRLALQTHLQLMSDLAKLMPHYFDRSSRKKMAVKRSRGDTDTATNSENKSDQITRFLCDCKSSVCTEESIREWLALFSGGYQGLKLGQEDGKKLDHHFNVVEFLTDLNSAYQHIALTAFNIVVSHFDTFIQHRVNTPRTTAIRKIYNEQKKENETSVFVAADGTYLGLNEFLKRANIFSFAILESKVIRYTCNGGLLFD